MHAYLMTRVGRSYAVVREERGVRTTIESGLGWDEALARRLFHEQRDPPPVEPVVVEAPRCVSQPGRRKFAKDRTITRAARSRVRWRRPYCCACETFMPAPDEPREYWIEPNGHRAPNGEVCPGGTRVVVLSPNDRRVLLELRAMQADNDNTKAKPTRRRRRKKRRKGRQKRQRWVQLMLVDTPVISRVPRMKLVRPERVPSVLQLSLEQWLGDRIQPADRVSA